MKVLVTGGNRGLGLEFCRQLLLREECKVIATCRQVSRFPTSKVSASASALQRLQVFPLDLTNTKSITDIPDLLRKSGHTDLDIIIHNAGVSSSVHPSESVLEANVTDLLRCYNTNVIGTFELTKCLIKEGLLTKEKKKILFISSKMGSLTHATINDQTANGWTSNVSYRTSKAALNMIVRCLAAEKGGKQNATDGEGEFIFTTLHPGWVDTDMGSAGGRSPPLSPEESIKGILQIVDDLTDEDNGKFYNYDGSTLPW